MANVTMRNTILSIFFVLLHSSTIVNVQATPGFIKPKGFPFKKFNEARDVSFLDFQGYGHIPSIDGGALQLTPDTLNARDVHINKSGRIMYYKTFKLWQADNNDKEDDDILATFNMHFAINIFRNRTWNAGEGLAFLIAPNLTIPEASYGQWLGLTNSTTDNNPRNKIVAVEFDTEMQEDLGDPDDNHVGLNINSVRSRKNVSLSDYNITISPEVGTNYSVWIDYNGRTRSIEVYMALRGERKPKTPILNDTINLKNYVEQESYLGFAASTGDPQIQLNCVLEWDLEIEELLEKRDRKWLYIGAAVGVPVLLVFIISLVMLVVYMNKRRKTRDQGPNVRVKLQNLPGVPKEFEYKDLKKATNNFHESMKLGAGGFGVVYKGVMRDENQNVTELAVKKFSRENIKGIEDFLAELAIIHGLHHKHLVRLVGWCYGKKKLMLVYDFMPNGSLDKHLYDPYMEDTLNWRQRYNILEGTAAALQYLHTEYYQKVVHRDIKSSNILLDLEFNARLGDFGLARALENEGNSYAELALSGIPGTMGYVAPECFHTRKATPESDVFGFGAVVLELICGRHPGIMIQEELDQYTLVDWVWMLHRFGRLQEAVDHGLNNEYEVEEAEKLLLLGLACSHPIASKRPRTQDIVQIISGNLPSPDVPPFKPAFTWPSIPMLNTTISSILSNFTSSSQDCGRIYTVEEPLRSSEDLPA